MGDVDFQVTVECVANGAPHGAAAARFLEAVHSLPESLESHFLRCVVTWELFQRTEKLLERLRFDLEEYTDILGELADRIEANWRRQCEFNARLDFASLAAGSEDFRAATQEHYGSLFKRFDEQHYFVEAAELLRVRLERNRIALGDISRQRALDAGCGGGRYSNALKQIGFGHVTGLDFSSLNIETANQRKDVSGVSGLEFQVGNVLDLPFEDGSFDFVFSNGVLHHTESIGKGLKEIRRVLKTSGHAWLYVIEAPGGLHWDMIELLRNVMRPVSRSYARSLFALMGVPGNRTFYILDHIMVPINKRSTIDEIEQLAREAGFGTLQRLTRGVDFDRVEQIQQRRVSGNDEDLIWKFGVGEHRYVMAPS